jgi:hypothetical protein
MRKLVVVGLLVAVFALVGWGVARLWSSDEPPSSDDRPAAEVRYHSRQLGDLCAAVVESSGLAPSSSGSRRFWTINDGGPPELIEVSAEGRCVERPVPGAEVFDWEALALGPDGYLYIGDVGDNLEQRSEIVVYRVPEADPSAPAEALTLTYPDGPHDAESLFVAPNGDLYIVTKGSRPRAYRASAPLQVGSTTALQRLGRVAIPEILPGPTGADIDPAGNRIVFVTYLGAYELQVVDGDVARSLRGTPREIGLPVVEQREAIAFAPSGGAFYWTSEGQAPPLYVTRRREVPVR